MLNLPALTAFSFNETCPFILLQTWTLFSHLIKQIQLLRNLCLVFFFLLYRKHPNSSDCYCVGYLCDWVELQSKKACFLFLQKPLFLSPCARQVILKCWMRGGVIVPALCFTILFYVLLRSDSLRRGSMTLQSLTSSRVVLLSSVTTTAAAQNMHSQEQLTK